MSQYPEEGRPLEPFSCDEHPEQWCRVLAWEEARGDYYKQQHNKLVEALRYCVEALEGCYDVCDYPCNGKTVQDQAIAKAKQLLGE